ncbi:hypothetical protein COBT_000293 [Conglomerata obtusa]
MDCMLLHLFFWSIVIAETRVYTFRDIYTDLQEFQNLKIVEQSKCYESHINDSFIVLYYENKNKNDRKLIQDGIISMLDGYEKLVGKQNLTFTSTYAKKNKPKEFFDSLLTFLQSAYMVNNLINNGIKTANEIVFDNRYLLKQDVSDLDKFQNAFKENENLIGEDNENGSIYDQNNNLLLINNCLDTQDDFALFYRETGTFIDALGDSYKDFEKFGCFVFFALKFDDPSLAKSYNFLSLDHYFYFSNVDNFTSEIKIYKVTNKKPYDRIENLNLNEYKIAESIHYIPKKEKQTNILYLVLCKHLYRISSATVHSISFNITKRTEKSTKILPKSGEQLCFDKVQCKCYSITIGLFFLNTTFYFYQSKPKIDNNLTDEAIVWRYNVAVYLKMLYYEQFLFGFVCCKRPNENIVISYDDSSTTSTHEIEIKGHLRVEKFLTTIKNLLNRTFIEYNFRDVFEPYVINNNQYLSYNSTLQNEVLSIPWDYNDIQQSVIHIIKEISKKTDLKPKFNLYKYDFVVKNYIDYKHYIAPIKIVRSVKNLEFIQQINMDSILNSEKLGDEPKLLLEIVYDRIHYKQFYYLFLPIYEFNVAKFENCFCSEKVHNIFFDSVLQKDDLHFGNTSVEMKEFFKTILQKIKFDLIYNICFELKTDHEYLTDNLFDIIVSSMKSCNHFQNFANLLTSQEADGLGIIRNPLDYNGEVIDRDFYANVMAIGENSAGYDLYEFISNSFLTFPLILRENFIQILHEGKDHFCFLQNSNMIDFDNQFPKLCEIGEQYTIPRLKADINRRIAIN